MLAQIQVSAQLNPDVWDKYLTDYWDKQLCLLTRYGFPLDYKEGSPIQHELKNHSKTNLHTDDVKAYLEEEGKYGAIFGPYEYEPLNEMHFLSFFMKDKPGAAIEGLL